LIPSITFRTDKLPAKRARNQIRVEFNRDSSLDESKIQKVKNKLQKKRKAKPKRDASPPDDFYQMYLDEIKEKNKVARKRRAAVKNIQISTPVPKQRKTKENLLFGLSPIGPNDVSAIVDEGEASRGASLYLELREKKQKEIEAKAKERLEKRMEKRREIRKRPLVNTENVQVTGEEILLGNAAMNVQEIEETPQALEGSFVISKRQKMSEGSKRSSVGNNRGSGEEKSTEACGNSLEDQGCLEESMKVPGIQVSAVESEAGNTQEAEVLDELEEEESAKSLVEEERSQLEREAFTQSPMELSATEKSPEPRKSSNFPRPSPSSSSQSIPEPLTQPLPSLKSPNNSHQPPCDLEKTILEPVIEEISKKIAKKSVAINLVPSVQDISCNPPAYHITTRNRKQPSLVKKSVGFSMDFDDSSRNITLHPGKWRKSLVAWRKSQKMSFAASTVHEETAASSKAEQYSEKILSALGECKSLLRFL
jgi:hypothetical protein